MGGSASCAWLVVQTVFKDLFCRCAIRTASVDKDLEIRFHWPVRLPRSKRAGQSGQDERQDEESVSDHDSAATQSRAATHSSRLRLIRLPGDCPELNPDELLNQDVKTNGLGKSRRQTGPNSWPLCAAICIGARNNRR